MKSDAEVAYNLIDILNQLGALSVLRSDNRREFANQLIEELKNMLSYLAIVHGKPRYS